MGRGEGTDGGDAIPGHSSSSSSSCRSARFSFGEESRNASGCVCVLGLKHAPLVSPGRPLPPLLHSGAAGGSGSTLSTRFQTLWAKMTQLASKLGAADQSKSRFLLTEVEEGRHSSSTPSFELVSLSSDEWLEAPSGISFHAALMRKVVTFQRTFPSRRGDPGTAGSLSFLGPSDEDGTTEKNKR